MKKIGLAVCYDTKNFGSQLQVLATVKKLENLGYNTEIIRYRKKITPAFVKQTIPRLFNISFLKSKIEKKKKERMVNRFENLKRNVTIRNKRFSGFVDNNFKNLSKYYDGWESLKRESALAYDIFLCGSDQLWLPNNLGSHFYTLEFAPDDKLKIAYATSFGVKQIPKFQKKATIKYLSRFNFLSTRELSGKKIISDLTGKSAKVVCDPTMLFTRDGWSELIPDKKICNEPYIFCYLLGSNPDHRKIAQEFKEKTGLKIITCPFLDNFVKDDQFFGDYQMYDLDAADFVNLIRHAEYILTDSFHGSVFSILHHKKFMIFNRFGNEANSRNSRIDSLCINLGLESRRFSGDVMHIQEEIDYNLVDEKLDNFRQDSTDYLISSLK